MKRKPTDAKRMDWLIGPDADGRHRFNDFLDFYYSSKNKAEGIRNAIDAAMRSKR